MSKVTSKIGRRNFLKLTGTGAVLGLTKIRKTSEGKALFHGDSAYAVPKKNLTNPFGPHCANQEVRAEFFRESFYNAYARKDFVGWDWCGWLDHWESLKPNKQHAGLQDAFGVWDQPIQKEIRRFSEKMYEIAIGKK